MADDYRVQSELVMGRLAREALLEMAEELEREAATRMQSRSSTFPSRRAAAARST